MFFAKLSSLAVSAKKCKSESSNVLIISNINRIFFPGHVKTRDKNVFDAITTNDKSHK